MEDYKRTHQRQAYSTHQMGNDNTRTPPVYTESVSSDVSDQDPHPIYGALLTDDVMLLDVEQFKRYCELRQHDRHGDEFRLVSRTNESEHCNLEILRLVSGAIESNDTSASEYKCMAPISAIRFLVSALYNGIMPDEDVFKDPDFCRMVFELDIRFLMRFCNSTGVLGDNPAETAVTSSSSDSIADSNLISQETSSIEEEDLGEMENDQPADEGEKTGEGILPFLIVDGFKYILGKTYGNSCYYYCQWKRKGPHGSFKTREYCRASLALDIKTQKVRYIHTRHLETCRRVQRVGMIDELPVRVQIERMIEDAMTTTQIHQQLLKLQREGGLNLPNTINREYIERLVRQRQKKRGPVVSKTMFTAEQAKLGEVNFVQLECQLPFLLIFATKTSVAAADLAPELFVGKIMVEAPEGKRVAVMFSRVTDKATMKTDFKPSAWIVFDKTLTDRDGAYVQATMRYLGWTANRLKMITSDLDSEEESFIRCLLNARTVDYSNPVQIRTTKFSYLTKVRGILKMLEGLPECQQFNTLKSFPDMTGTEITEALDRLEKIKNGKRAIAQWKKLFGTKISQIATDRIALDKGRNAISQWLVSLKIPKSWDSFIEHLKGLHQEVAFPEDNSLYD